MSQQSDGSKTIVVRNKTGDLPFPWSEKDPYRLPVSIERVQRQLMNAGALHTQTHAAAEGVVAQAP